MSRKKFMEELESLLYSLPMEERKEALAYYEAYFEDAGESQEQIVIDELGSPKRIAEQIIRDFNSEMGDGFYTEHGYSDQEAAKEMPVRYQEKENQDERVREATTDGSGIHITKKKMNRSVWILILILAILTFPVWISVLATAFGLLVGFAGAMFGIVVGAGMAGIGCAITGVVLVIVGIVKTITLPVVGLSFAALGLICFGVGCLLLTVTVLCVHLVVWLVKQLINVLNHRFHGKKEATV